MSSLGERIVLARKKSGLNQKELAEKLNITPTRLNYYEKDKREPDVLMLKKIAYALNVDPNYLLGEWHSSLYEDFNRAKSDEERLHILKRAGVPYRLNAEYRKLQEKFADPAKGDIDISLVHEEIIRLYGTNAIDLLIAYRDASESDREIFDNLVRRHPISIKEKTTAELAPAVERAALKESLEAEAREFAAEAYEQYLSEKIQESQASSAPASAGTKSAS